MEGLEPPHLTASDPKSDVSTNFTTSGGNCLQSRLKFDVWRQNLTPRTSNLKQLFWAANVGHFSLPNGSGKRINYSGLQKTAK